MLPLWWAGMGGVVAGSIGDFIAVGMASQSLAVASGGATVLVCNCVVARFWHKENISIKALVGVFLIIFGAVLFSVYSPASKDYTLDELWELVRA